MSTEIGSVRERDKLLSDHNCKRWSRTFLQAFLHNNACAIQSGLDLIAALERNDAARVAKTDDA